MGSNSSKKNAEKKYKLYKENEYKRENKDEENKNVIEYKNFKSKYKFCEGNEITIQLNELFAVQTSYNYTYLHDDEDDKPNNYAVNDIGLELVTKKSFYPYPSGYTGGNTYYVYVFRGIIKGVHYIHFDMDSIEVTIVDKLK